MPPPIRPLPLFDPTPPKGPVQAPRGSGADSVHRRVLRLARQVQHPLGPAPRPNRAEYPYVGTIEWPGLPRILVETAAGQARHWGGGAANGGGSTQMLMHYGEFDGTTGADGDPIDVYVGPERGAPFAFVVHQQRPSDRVYDEDKVLLGFASQEDALAMYRAHYDRRGFVQGVRRLSIVELADWLRLHGRSGNAIGGGRVLAKAEPLCARCRCTPDQRARCTLGAEPGPLEEGELTLEVVAFLGLEHLVIDGGAITKGAGHKYIRRVPKPGGGYRYYYAVTGGATLGAAAEFVVGAAFAVSHGGQKGHFHVVEVAADGRIRLQHDETGKTMWVAEKALRDLLHLEHLSAIRDHHDRRLAEVQSARVFGSARQLARAQAALDRFMKDFPESRPWLKALPSFGEPKWVPKGYAESARAADALEVLTELLDERVSSPERRALVGRVAGVARAALAARYGDLSDPAVIETLERRLTRLDPKASLRTVDQLLWALETVPLFSAEPWHHRHLAGIARAFRYEHAKLDLAVDRKEPLRVDVALFLDEIKTAARNLYYVEGKGSRTGLQTLLDIAGQVRTARGVAAMDTLLRYRGGPGAANTRAARETLGWAWSSAVDRLKAGRKALERSGRADLVSTVSRPTLELDAAIAADVELLAGVEGYNATDLLESAANYRIELEPFETGPGQATHRFSQLKPHHSAVKRLFAERFGVRIALEDDTFDAFVERPEAEIEDPKTGDQRRILAGPGRTPPEQLAKLKPEDQARFRRYEALQAGGWGLYGGVYDSRGDKSAAAEVTLAKSLSQEARADALRAVFNALADLETTLGRRLDLSMLPVVVCDRFVAVGAKAHYASKEYASAFERERLAGVRVTGPRRGMEGTDSLLKNPHIAVGLGVDKSLGHEVAHYLDNRTTVRGGQPVKALDDGLTAWANANGRQPEEAPDLAPALADLDRNIRFGREIRPYAYLSNMAAELVKRADHPAWQTANAKALRQILLDEVAKTPLGKAQVDLHLAVAAVGAGRRFIDADQASAGYRIAALLEGPEGGSNEPPQYYAKGTEVVARAVEQYLFETGLKQGRINSALTHTSYQASADALQPSVYFTPEEWSQVAPKVEALLAAFGDNMTKALGAGAERLTPADLLARAEAAYRLNTAEEELDEAFGEALWAAEEDEAPDRMEKGAGHKYIRREAKPGGGWRYYYRAAGVTRVRADDDAHFAVGAKFAVKHAGRAGHFEVVGAEGDTLTVRHDETGHVATISRSALAAMFAREHATLVDAHRDRLKRDLAQAARTGTPTQVARLEAEARRHGHHDLVVPKASPRAPAGVNDRSPGPLPEPPPPPASVGDVPVGGVIKVGAKRYERTVSAWAELDARGGRTGSVTTFKRIEQAVAAAGGFTLSAPGADGGPLSAAEQRQREEAARRSAEKRRKAGEAPEAPKPLRAPVAAPPEPPKPLRAPVASPPEPPAPSAAAGGAEAAEPAQAGLDFGEDLDDASPAAHVEVGSHVAGSRKDLAGLSTGEVRDLPIEDAVRAITRDKLLPTWSEASLKARGAGPGALLLLKAIRRAISPTPDPGVLNDPAKRLAYIDALTFVGRTFSDCKTAVDVDTALREWGMLSGGRKRIGVFTSQEAAFAASKAAYASTDSKTFILPGDRHGMVTYHREQGRWFAFGPLSAAEEAEAEREGGGKNPYQARIQILGSTFRKLMRAPDLWDDSYRFRGKTYATAFVEGQKADRQGWPQSEDSGAGSDAGAGGVTSAGSVPKAPPKRSVFRWQRDAGPAPVRQGGQPVESADAEAMAREFGLHNVQFGLWATQEDRDHHLRACHGALRDLSEILGLAPEVVTLQRATGKSGRKPLSIGIAARGTGHAAAHYEPHARDESTGVIAPIINLTRFAGGGSLAHEWGHFLDNVMSEAHGGQRRMGNPTGQPGYLSEGDALDAVTPSVKNAIRGVMGAIRGTGLATSSFAIDAMTLGTYWSKPREMFARAFEAYIEDKLAAQSRANTYLVTGTQKVYATGKGRKAKVAVGDLVPEHQAALAAVDVALKAATEARNRIAQPELEAAKARSRGGIPSIEVMRRIYDRADQHPEVLPLWAAYRAATAQAREARQAQMTEVDAQPYPQGSERRAINAAFDRLFAEIRADRTLEKALDLLARARALKAGGGR